jgi:glycosyltransferase involved in cell wall biosynthesis
MRIAMIGQKGIPALWGGIERHVEELSARLAKNGHAVFVFARGWYTKIPKSARFGKTRGRRDIMEYRGTNIVFAPTIHTKHFDAIIHSLFSTFKALRLGVDVIHYHGVGPALVSWIPKFFGFDGKVIITFHCIDRKHKKWGFFARAALRIGEWMACRFADRTIAVSEVLRQYCDEAYNTETAVIPNGVSIPRFRKARLIKNFNLESYKYLGFFSRLVPHKNAHLLIAAWKNIRAKNPALLRGIKLAIVGDSSFTDKYVEYLKKISADDTSIVMTGYQSGATLEELFSNAKFIVHPSESEGLSIAVLEAMSYGKPVLASDIPENKEALGNCGFYFKRNNSEDLERQIISVLRKKTLKKIGDRAKLRITENFDWKKIVKQTESVYKLSELKLAETIT